MNHFDPAHILGYLVILIITYFIAVWTEGFIAGFLGEEPEEKE